MQEAKKYILRKGKNSSTSGSSRQLSARPAPVDLSTLNPSQLDAVEHSEGPLLIFAGAGSGKTRVLTHRIARLIQEEIAFPWQILAVTFTNKAAKEMKERVELLLDGPGSTSPSQNSGSREATSARTQSRLIWISTFHSSCARILRRYCEHLGYTKNFAIYDTKDSVSLIKQLSKRLNIDPKLLPASSVMRQIDRAKNKNIDPDSYKSTLQGYNPTAEKIAELYSCYQDELLKCNAMDFGDLLCNTVALLKLSPVVLESLQEKFRYIHIDEYQDTNEVQYQLIRLLAEKYQNLCVVGDDDQSIYAFRGATIENILSFQRDYPDAEVITLSKNYRSTGNILKAANAVIAFNKRRRKKEMQTDRGDGEAIRFYATYTEKEEAEAISEEISSLRKSGIPYEEIAIFYRTNAQSRALEEGLCNYGIPYTIFGGLRFYDRKEIKDILSYYRLLLNPDDNQAFLRVVNTPTRGIGSTTVNAIIAAAEKNRISCYRTALLASEVESPVLETANEAAKAGDIPIAKSKAAKEKIAAFCELIESLREEVAIAETKLSEAAPGKTDTISDEIIAEILQSIAVKSGYFSSLKSDKSEQGESRIENIWELCAVATEFIKQAKRSQGADAEARSNSEETDVNQTESDAESVGLSLQGFLERTSLVSDLDGENTRTANQGKKKQSGVSLMTLHLAKGLEFEVGFLTGMEDGILPHGRSFDSLESMEEERRLCYVGITRAKSQLYLTMAEHRSSFGSASRYSGGASRFLEEIPESVLLRMR